jgi:hypothetical protein
MQSIKQLTDSFFVYGLYEQSIYLSVCAVRSSADDPRLWVVHALNIKKLMEQIRRLLAGWSKTSVPGEVLWLRAC